MAERHTQEELAEGLRVAARVVRRRRASILGFVLVVAGAALIGSLIQDPVYESTAELLLEPRDASLFDSNTGRLVDPARNIETEIRVLQSRPVRDKVRAAIGSAPPVHAHAVGVTDLIEVSARSGNAEEAARIANAYAESYIEFRRDGAVNSLVQGVERLQSQVDEQQTEINGLQGQVNELPPGDDTGLATTLKARLDSALQQQQALKEKLDQLQVDASLRSGGAQLVTPADPSKSPVEPRPVRTVAVALVIGLVLGLAQAFLFEYLDDTIKTREDLERVIGDRAVLGMTPASRSWKGGKDLRAASIASPNSVLAESYRALRTSIQFAGLGRPLQILQVTSPSSSEGKTTTIANLAVTLAQAGQRVVAVSCDLRRPRLHEFFGLSNEVGFTSVLLRTASISDALQKVPGHERLRFLAAGPAPPNPSELLSHPRTRELFDALKAQADIVLVDSPPVLPVTDAAVLSRVADGVLIVANAGSTTRKALRATTTVLDQVGAPIVGFLLNAVRDQESPYSHYGYEYTPYSAKEPHTNGAKKTRPAIPIQKSPPPPPPPPPSPPPVAGRSG